MSRGRGVSSVSLGIILHMWLTTLVQICCSGNGVATINIIKNPMKFFWKSVISDPMNMVWKSVIRVPMNIVWNMLTLGI